MAKIPVSKGDTEAEQLVASRRTTQTQMASVISGVRCGLEYLPQVFRTVKDSWELCIAQEAKGRRFNYEQDYYFFLLSPPKNGGSESDLIELSSVTVSA